jgi:hypothetical protein
MDVARNYSLYHVKLETIFEAPFSGRGYVMGTWDDFLDMDVLPLDADGRGLGEPQRMLQGWYSGCASGLPSNLSCAESSSPHV